MERSINKCLDLIVIPLLITEHNPFDVSLPVSAHRGGQAQEVSTLRSLLFPVMSPH